MARTPPRYSPPVRDLQAIQEVQRCIDEAKRWHNLFAKKVDRRYEAWRGMLPESDENRARGWRSAQHPPHLINIVEGMLSSLEEENPLWDVTPRAVPGLTIEEAISASESAELSSYLLSMQMRIDDYAYKAGQYAHQDLVAGFTVAKVFWLQQKKKITNLMEVPANIFDEFGGTIDIAKRLEEYDSTAVVRDDPSFEVRDVRDFLYPESAISLEAAPWVIDRTYVTYDTLLRMENLGVYKNVKFVQETRYDDSNARTNPQRDRERRLHNADRTRGLVEVLELWKDDQVITVGNGEVLLRLAENPFKHGHKPFVICSAIPDMFQIPGVSVIEGLASMQEMLWTLTNMRIDATRIASNVITQIRGDVDDPEQYEWAPEAQWIVPDMQSVQVVDMTAVANAAAASLQAEGILRGDIQNVMGGLPFTGGAQNQTLPTDTATGVSIITNIAQAILARRKGFYQRASSRIGQLFLELDQQFIREERLVEVLGEGNARHYLELQPMDIQGIWDVNLRVEGESLLRQERRAENQSLVTMAMQAAAIMAQSGAPLNLRRFWERLLDAYGVTDKATFFNEQQAQQAPQEAPGTPPTADQIQQQQTGSMDAGGITNPSLAAGPSAPSSPVTMSAGAPMQRSLAMNGAGRSA